MKTVYIIGNWKSNKTTVEAAAWLKDFESLTANNHSPIINNKIIILAASFTLLPFLKSYIVNRKSTIKVAAQDISPFPPGPYTGEVNAEQIKEFAEYVLIGHSERRDNFGEKDDLLAKKIAVAYQNGLLPVLCVQSENTPVPDGVSIVAYEPPGAISTVSKGIPDDPNKVIKVIKAIKKKYPSVPVIYGGSVNGDNVSSFTSFPEIQGALPGAASLDPQKFFQIVKNA